jgi:hypothetical protein
VYRYLYAQILLLRPALLIPLDDTEEVIPSHHHKLIDHATKLCVSSCSRLLKILHSSLDSQFRVADWHVVYSKYCRTTNNYYDYLLTISTSSDIYGSDLSTSHRKVWRRKPSSPP